MYIVSKGHCVACGSLPRDAELKKVGGRQSSCTNFSIKADETTDGSGKTAIWLRCTCWNKLAKFAAQLEKGDTVFVAGKLREYSYKSQKTGEQVTGKELVCDMVIAQEVAGDTYVLPEQAQEAQGVAFQEEQDNGELPF